MHISQITINNFRIYKEHHSLFFNADEYKNLFIVSGSNGYGKTTFLTTMVWCLYGKQMRDVDDIYKRQINEVGGYAKYLQSCLNRLSQREGNEKFEVSITLKDLNIPSLPCNEIKVVRSGNYSGVDKLQIFIDGFENELTKEVGNEIFIQDYILPKEVAKFFFFDAEKIVYLAEIKSIHAKRQLSKAYSEVLGIKKYEDLRKNMSDLRLRFRKNSAQPKDKKKFKVISENLEQLRDKIADTNIEIDRFEEEKIILKKEVDQLQEKLIREGSKLSVDEINNLKIEKHRLGTEIEKHKSAFKDLLDFACFAIAGKLLKGVKEQLELEKEVEDDQGNMFAFRKKTRDLIAAFSKISIDPKLDSKYKKELERLAEELFVQEEAQNELEEKKTLHAFTKATYNSFSELYFQLQTTYAARVKEIGKALKYARNKRAKLSKKLSDAESKGMDGVIAKYRLDKKEKDDRLEMLENELLAAHQIMGSLQNELNAKRRIQEELAKKIKVHERYEGKDLLAHKLISQLDDFLSNIKLKKKASLEKGILDGLKILMHKKDFVDRVAVEIQNDIIDIHLFNSRGVEINKELLSKGEQQLYATAILKALVEESNIEFPVFIDSPLQKFDASHAKNIISHFYPSISKQVVLLPLLNKEMTRDEYALIQHKVQAAYIIQNETEDRSSFLGVKPLNLFEAAEKLNAHVC